jgi:hypothetical protein
MLRNIAYLIVFIIFGVTAFIYMTIDKEHSLPENLGEPFETIRPDYDNANIETIFKKELGNNNND